MTYVFAKKINGADETGIVDITKNPPELICLCDKAHSELLLQALNISSKQVVSGQLAVDECKCIRFKGGDKWYANGCKIHPNG